MHLVEITMVTEPRDETSNAGNPCQTIVITFTSEIQPSMETAQKVWLIDDPESLCMKTIGSVNLEPDDDGNVDLNDLIGKKVKVLVEPNGRFQNVVAAYPIEEPNMITDTQ